MFAFFQFDFVLQLGCEKFNKNDKPYIEFEPENVIAKNDPYKT